MVTSQSVQRLAFETPKFVFGDLGFDFITNPSVRNPQWFIFLFHQLINENSDRQEWEPHYSQNRLKYGNGKRELLWVPREILISSLENPTPWTIAFSLTYTCTSMGSHPNRQ